MTSSIMKVLFSPIEKHYIYTSNVFIQLNVHQFVAAYYVIFIYIYNMYIYSKLVYEFKSLRFIFPVQRGDVFCYEKLVC